MYHQASEFSSPSGPSHRAGDLQSRLSAMRAEIELIETEYASPASCRIRGVREVIDARARRRQFFGRELFADPAWDILLELYAYGLAQRRISVSKLAFAIEVPGTTVLRWIAILEKEGLVLRSPDTTDGRRTWVSLSALGLERMETYFASI